MRMLLGLMLCAAPMMGQAMIQGTTPSSATQVVTGVVPGLQVPGTIAPGASGYKLISPVVMPTISPGQVELLELEAHFAEDVAKGGGGCVCDVVWG